MGVLKQPYPTSKRNPRSYCALPSSALSPGLRRLTRRPVVRTAVSTSGPPAKALGSRPWAGPHAGSPRRAAWVYLAGIVGISHLPTVMISGQLHPRGAQVMSHKAGPEGCFPPFTTTGRWPAPHTGPLIRLCTPFCLRRPSSSGVSRTGVAYCPGSGISNSPGRLGSVTPLR